MNNWHVNTTVDLDRLNTARVLENSNALFNYADIVAHTWNITVLRSGEAADLTGYSSTLTVRRPDGNKPVTNCTISGNVITVDFPQVCYAIEGECVAVIKLVKAGDDPEEITIAAMTYTVVNYDGTGTIIDPGTLVTDISVLQGYVTTMNEATAAANTAAAGAAAYPALIAPDFSTSETYSLGALVIYDGALYRCTKPVTTAGSWDSTKWTACSINDNSQFPLYAITNFVSAMGYSSSAEGSISLGDLPLNRIVYFSSAVHPSDNTKSAFTDEPVFRFMGIVATLSQSLTAKSGSLQIAMPAFNGDELYWRRATSNGWNPWHQAAPGESIAPQYDKTATYAGGDYCYYQGKLYVCKTAISTAETWHSSKWTEKTINGILKNFESRIAALEA